MARRGSRKVVVAVVVLAAAIAAAQLAGLLGPTAAAQSAIVATRIEGALPATDPESALWDQAAPVDVLLSGQPVATPIRLSPFVPSLRVRILANGTHASFHIAWDDATKDNRSTMDREFRDAVAILFGTPDATPYVCMGGPGKQLQIAQWKADWQADLEEGFRDLHHAYPNFWVDFYPYAIGAPPYGLPDAFPEVARVYLPGWYVGNPFSDPLKVTAVEEAVAQGFGTLATQARQDAIGRGVHSGTGWQVVITRPLASTDVEDVAIGTGTLLAFAVWDGTSGDVGSRKSVSAWFVLDLPAPVVPAFLMTLLLLVTVGVVTVLLFDVWRRRRRKAAPAEAPPDAEDAAEAPAGDERG